MEIEVIVQSILPSDGPQGRYRIKISQEASVETLLRKTCAEAHTAVKDTYCLRHAANKLLPNDASLQSCNVRNGEVVHWTDEDVVKTVSPRCNTWWFMCIISLLIGIVGLTAIGILKANTPKAVFDYGIVMDAGSSHTSLFVYKWNGAKYKQTAIASQFGDTCRVPGDGISSYKDNPVNVSDGLKHCLDFAQTIVPQDNWKKTPVYLGATAGMRLLRKVNSTVSEAIFTEVRKTIQEYPFLFDEPEVQARIISGADEGAFSWVTSNYVSKSFHVPSKSLSAKNETQSETIGALDMGGASAQISFIPANYTVQPANYSQTIQLYGVNYTLYTHSFLCYGVNEAVRRIQAALAVAQNYSLIIDDPCAPKDVLINTTFEEVFKAPCTGGIDGLNTFGFNFDSPADIIHSNKTIQFRGQSNVTECKSVIENHLFNFTQPCKFPGCSFNGQFQPAIYGNFYAFSTFFYVTKFLNLTDGINQFSLEEFENATNKFCNKTWQEVENIPSTLAEKLPFYCFEANYILTMLTTGYGFNTQNWNTLKFVQQVENTNIGWSLGFMLNESNQIPVDKPTVPLALLTFILLVILFSLFILVSLAFACHAKKYSQNKGNPYKLFSNKNYDSL